MRGLLKWSLLVATVAATQWFVGASPAAACWGCRRACCYYSVAPCYNYCSQGWYNTSSCGCASYGCGTCSYSSYGCNTCGYGYGCNSCGYGSGYGCNTYGSGYGCNSCGSGYGCNSCGSGYGCNSCGSGGCGVGTCCHDSVQPDIALRQCRIAYFDSHYSVWVEVDVLVPYYEAAVGLSTCAKVPGDGYQRGWITQVATIPNVGPPQFHP